MIAAAIFLASAQAAAPAAYPSAEILRAFGEVCRDLKDLGQTEAKAKVAGWASFTPEPTSPMGQLVEFGATEGKKITDARGGSITPMRVLRREVAGEQLVAVLSGVRMEGTSVHGCRVYDVGETRQIDVAVAQQWVGRAPSSSASNAALAIARWEPGYGPDHDSFDLYFIPQGSPALELVKVSGVALKADFVGAE